MVLIFLPVKFRNRQSFPWNWKTLSKDQTFVHYLYNQYQITTRNQSKISNQFKMSDLYYVTKIRGCIALKDIKKGTLIVSESPKLIAKGNPWSLDPTCKGQIMSKCIYEIIDFPRYHQKHLIDFCPGRFYRLGTCNLLWLFTRQLYSGECITYLVWMLLNNHPEKKSINFFWL